MSNQNQSSGSLLPDIPVDIRAARIGSCMNTLTKTFKPLTPSFHPGKLNSKGLLRFVGGKGTFKVTANSSSYANADGSFFSLASEAEGSAWGCKASLGFKMGLAQRSAASGYGLNCFVSYVFEGQSIHLLRASAQEYYNCMMESFQERYDRIMNSKTIPDYIKSYNEFTEEHGDGCVTTLYLTSGSAFRITLKQDSEEESNKHTYGVAAAINTPWGDGSVATEWGNDTASAIKEASLEVIGETIPQKSPTTKWCQDRVDKFMDKAISYLADKANAPSPPEIAKIESPKIPSDEPGKKKIPEAKKKLNSVEIENTLIKQLMFEDGFKDVKKAEDYTSDDIEEYKKAQNELIEKLSPEQVVKEAENVRATLSDIEHKAEVKSRARASTTAEGDIWDLGDYIPFAYEITPWKELFPALKFELPSSFTSINIAKIFIFYLTRLEFSQYLMFLNDVGPILCENDQIEIDAANFTQYCKDFLDVISNELKHSDNFSEEDCINLIHNFEAMLRDEENKGRFFSKKVYRTFFDKYQLFADNPYGFVIVRGDPLSPLDPYEREARNRGYKVSQSKFTALPDPFGVGKILEDANRAYPVITRNGKLKLAIYEDELPYRGRDPPVRDPASGFLFDFAIELDDAGHRRILGRRDKIGSKNESEGISIVRRDGWRARNPYIYSIHSADDYWNNRDVYTPAA